MQFNALPQEAWIVIGIAVVLVGAATLFAIAKGQAISVAFKRGTTQLDVGVSKKTGPSEQAKEPASIQGEVLRNGRVSKSDVRVHIGNTVGGKHD
jgi:hypothetical protein